MSNNSDFYMLSTLYSVFAFLAFLMKITCFLRCHCCVKLPCIHGWNIWTISHMLRMPLSDPSPSLHCDCSPRARRWPSLCSVNYLLSTSLCLPWVTECCGGLSKTVARNFTNHLPICWNNMIDKNKGTKCRRCLCGCMYYIICASELKCWKALTRDLALWFDLGFIWVTFSTASGFNPSWDRILLGKNCYILKPKSLTGN